VQNCGDPTGRAQVHRSCESKAKCPQRATVGVECRDSIGHPTRRKDFCAAHAKPLIQSTQARGIEEFWH